MEAIEGVFLLIFSIGGLLGMWRFFEWVGDKQEEARDRYITEEFLKREAVKRDIAICQAEREAKEAAEKKLRKQYGEYVERVKKISPTASPYRYEAWKQTMGKYLT